jgi:hypothetical protein
LYVPDVVESEETSAEEVEHWQRVRLLSTQVNNQLVAETVHAHIQTAEICLARRGEIRGYPLKANDGRYLDGVDVLRNGRPQVYAVPENAKEFMFQGYSGVTRLLPPDLFIALRREPDRMRLVDFDRYLHGLGPLRFALKAASASGNPDSDWVTVEYDHGMNVLCEAKANPSDWWIAMRDTLPQEVLKPTIRLQSMAPRPTAANKPAEKKSSKKPQKTAEKSQPTPSSSAPTRPKNLSEPTGFIQRDGKFFPVFEAPRIDDPWSPDVSDFGEGKGKQPQKKQEPKKSNKAPSQVLKTSEVNANFAPGQWLSQEVQRLPAADIRYMMSRAMDIADTDGARTRNGTAQKAGVDFNINPAWAASWRTYAPLPDFSSRRGQGKNWWVDFDPNRSIPEVFRLSGQNVLADLVVKGAAREIPRPVKNANGDLPVWVRKYEVFQNYRN